jgi:hypothetical protein
MMKETGAKPGWNLGPFKAEVRQAVCERQRRWYVSSVRPKKKER